MARRGGELEAFTAFCGGVVVAGLSRLGLRGLARLGVLPGPLHDHPVASVLLVGLGCTVTVYRALRAPERARLGRELETLKGLKDRQDSKSRAARSS